MRFVVSTPSLLSLVGEKTNIINWSKVCKHLALHVKDLFVLWIALITVSYISKSSNKSGKRFFCLNNELSPHSPTLAAACLLGRPRCCSSHKLTTKWVTWSQHCSGSWDLNVMSRKLHARAILFDVDCEVRPCWAIFEHWVAGLTACKPQSVGLFSV